MGTVPMYRSCWPVLRAQIRFKSSSPSVITPASTTQTLYSYNEFHKDIRHPKPSWTKIEKNLGHSISKGNTKEFHAIARDIIQLNASTNIHHGAHPTIPPPSVLQLVMQGCFLEQNISDSIDLYLSVASMYTKASTLTSSPPSRPQAVAEKQLSLPQFDHERIIFYLLKTIAHSKDFTNSLKLKIIWENYIFANTKAGKSELLYFSAFVNTLINTGQIEIALETFKVAYQMLKSDFEPSLVLSTFPTIRLLDSLSADSNCDELTTLLEMINQDCASTEGGAYESFAVPAANWFTYLNRALAVNHYGLVKLIYTNVIMKGFEEGLITTENVLFGGGGGGGGAAQYDPTSAPSLEGENIILDSITDEIILQVLHTLASNGDVALTLSLIESHFIHKTMKGERALTKELCVCIIEAYCFNEDMAETWEDDAQSESDTIQPTDHSVERVLDVLDRFMKKLEGEGKDTISYKDICDYMSFKFKNFKILDGIIESKKASKRLVQLHEQELQHEKEQLAGHLEDKPIVVEKYSNSNIESSLQGNVLANLDTLTTFVLSHIKYLQDQQSSALTIRLFINCLLYHVNMYQNLSGVIRVLANVHKQNSNMVTEWLDEDSMNIIVNATSKSSAAKNISIELFTYLKRTRGSVTSQQYSWFINSILRDDFHECLQFYLYNYLTDITNSPASNSGIDDSIIELLRVLPAAAVNMNQKTKSLVQFVEKYADTPISRDEVVDFWRTNELLEGVPAHISGKHVPELGRKYYKHIDLRDLKYFKYIFGT